MFETSFEKQYLLSRVCLLVGKPLASKFKGEACKTGVANRNPNMAAQE